MIKIGRRAASMRLAANCSASSTHRRCDTVRQQGMVTCSAQDARAGALQGPEHCHQRLSVAPM
jgi:hypothetical protein